LRFVVEEHGVVVVLVGEAAEGVVAGRVIAGSAGELAGGVFFAGALRAAIDVEPDHRVAGVDEFFREAEGVEGVGCCGVVELAEDGGDLVVGGVGDGDEGEGVVGLVEEVEGWGWDDSANRNARYFAAFDKSCEGRRFGGGFTTSEQTKRRQKYER
jgi:hypothetical protein